MPDFPFLGSKFEVRLTFLPREVTANVRCKVVGFLAATPQSPPWKKVRWTVGPSLANTLAREQFVCPLHIDIDLPGRSFVS